MTLGAHFLISWLCAVPLFKSVRERRLVAIAGLAPDFDGVGIIVDKLSGKTDLFYTYHHYVGHNVFASLLIAAVAAALAHAERAKVFCVSLLVIHLHFLCDVLGSKGPDGYQWPVYYLYPYSKEPGLTWSGQWELSAWQNQAIIAALFALCLIVLMRRKTTFLEVISPWLQREAFAMWKKYVQAKA
jgi:inner membrane protein